MRTLPVVAVAVIAAGLAGTAIAASPKNHVMNVPLPDGSVVRVEYVGDVAPKVNVDPAPLSMSTWDAMPSFVGFDRMIEQMNRQTEAMIRQAREMQIHAGVPGMNVASYGDLPAGTNSVSVVSYSNGGSTCTRTTEVVSRGAGKQPKVTTSVSGNCGAAAPSARQPAPVPTT